jgi:hypothetical protein
MIKGKSIPFQFAALSRSRQGLASLELSFAMPMLLVLSLAGLELTSAILVRKRIHEIGRLVADNASRISENATLQAASVRESDINDLFLGADLEAGTLNLRSNGRIILSSLERNANDGQWIHWQRCYGTLNFRSSYHAGQGLRGRGFPGINLGNQVITAMPGDAVMYVEIAYDYQPMISANWAGYSTQRIVAHFAMNVRDKRDLSGISPDAAAATC